MVTELLGMGLFPDALRKPYLDTMKPQIIVPNDAAASDSSQPSAKQLRAEGIVALRSTGERIIGTARVIGGLSVVSIGLLGTESLSMANGWYFGVVVLWAASLLLAIATNASTIGASLLTAYATFEDFEREFFAARRAYIFTCFCLILAGLAVIASVVGIERDLKL